MEVRLIEIPPDGGSTYDLLFTTNVAPFVEAGGSVLVIHKGRSRGDDKMQRAWNAALTLCPSGALNR